MREDLSTLRILHVADCYEGGVGRAIDIVAELLPELEHHFIWRGRDDPARDDRFATLTPLPRSPLEAIRTVRESVRRVRPHIVHAHSSWAGLFTRATRLDVPVVYQPHAYKFEDADLPWPVRKLYYAAEKALAPRSAQIAVLSPHEQTTTQRINSSVPTQYVPNVATRVPDAEFGSTAFATNREVVMIGRAAKQKSPAYYAQVARIVRAHDPRVTFRWVGDGPMREVLESAGIEVSGWISGSALSRELARPSLYFHSAAYEGFPLSILDAAAFEHPVAARQIHAFDDLEAPLASSPRHAADLILEILDGGAAYAVAVAFAQRLNVTMSRASQRQALIALYAAARR